MHSNLSQKHDDSDLCLKKKSTVRASDCQCDRGYEMQKVEKLFNILKKNRPLFYVLEWERCFMCD